MPDKIVVSFHALARVRVSPAPGYLERALAMKQRAEAHGASLCGWSAQVFSFELGPDELEEAIALACLATDEPRVEPGDRFGVGISQGPMHPVETGRSHLAWGRPLCVAVSLARVAKPGEILVDPDLPAAASGELLTVGSRIAVAAGIRVRGLRLDAAEPFRASAAQSVAKLRDPPLVGRSEALERIDVKPGGLGLVVAPSGSGGTRFLAEALARLSPERSLLIVPVGARREPLGALRRALSRSAALHGAPLLPPRLREPLSRLLGGTGTDLWSAAELVDAWLSPANAPTKTPAESASSGADAPAGPAPMLALDDAEEIDAPTLEAVAQALSVRGSFRAIARLSGGPTLPVALSGVAVTSTVTLGPLSGAEAERLVSGMTHGAIALEAVQRWAKRGGGFPLPTVEAVVESLASGELSWRSSVALPRKRSAGRGAWPARRFIERRLALLAPAERGALVALAMLGGDAPDVLVLALANAALGAAAPDVEALERLVRSRWLARPEPGWVRLGSRTAEDVVLRAEGDASRRTWHAATHALLSTHGTALGRADVAWHAAQAGELRAAAVFALGAALAASRAALETSTAQLFAFAHGLDPELAEKARRTTLRAAQLPSQAGRRPAPSPGAYAPAPAKEAKERRPPAAPAATVEVRTGVRDEPADEAGLPPAPSFERTGTSRSSPGADREPAPIDALLDEVFSTLEPGGAGGRESQLELAGLGADPLMATAEAPSLGARAGPAALSAVAKQALMQGDLAALERLVALDTLGAKGDLAARLSGFVSLGRGELAEALRRLRAAAETEQPPAQRARARLAYGVALAAAGRLEPARLEALDALARAREAGDAHGERACAGFLARLSTAAGDPGAAARWTEIALSPR